MEADWSIDVSPELPWIDAAWPGFVDLLISPGAVETMPEAVAHPALRDALLRLNAPVSPVYTCKCDAWEVGGNEIDGDEFGAQLLETADGFASYIDVLERNAASFASFAKAERQVRDLSERLRQVDLRCARVDAVVRSATTGGAEGYAMTLYVAACGVNHVAAYAAWQRALGEVVTATIAVAESHRGE